MEDLIIKDPCPNFASLLNIIIKEPCPNFASLLNTFYVKQRIFTILFCKYTPKLCNWYQ